METFYTIQQGHNLTTHEKNKSRLSVTNLVIAPLLKLLEKTFKIQTLVGAETPEKHC